MSFELRIWNQNKSQLLNTIRHTTPGGLSGGFSWQLQPNGDCSQLNLTGRNDRMALPPRGVVQLLVDGQAVFYGTVPDPPSAGSPNKEQAQVLGGREALRKTLLDGAVYVGQGVYQIVRDLLARLCPPSLTFDPTLIGDGSGTDAGPTLSTYYAPTSNLVTVLDALAKSAGVTWGVDAEGRIFFGRPAAAALTVAYAGRGWRRLRVQGREAVTRAVLRVVTAPAGLEGGWVQFSPSGVPATVTAIAEHPDHGLYRAEQAVEPPEGVALVVPQAPERWIARTNNVDGSAAVDPDPATFAAVPLGLTQLGVELESTLGRPVGVEVDYELPSVQDMPADAYALYLDVAGASGGLILQAGPRRTLRLILPPDAGAPGRWRARLLAGATLAVQNPPQVELRVYAVRFLVVDEAAAARTAQGFLQLPFASPAELTLPGLIPPTPTVTVTGSPDGDVEGPTSLWEYEHTPQRKRTTRVRLGSDGQSDVARAIKFAIRGGA